MTPIVQVFSRFKPRDYHNVFKKKGRYMEINKINKNK